MKILLSPGICFVMWKKNYIFFSSFRIFFLPISEKSTDRLNIVVLHCTRWMHLFFLLIVLGTKKKNCFLNSLFELFSRYNNNNNVLHIENTYIERVQSHLIWFMNFFFFFSLSSYLVYLTLNAYDGEEKKNVNLFFLFWLYPKRFFYFFLFVCLFFQSKSKKMVKMKMDSFLVFWKGFFPFENLFPWFRKYIRVLLIPKAKTKKNLIFKKDSSSFSSFFDLDF